MLGVLQRTNKEAVEMKDAVERNEVMEMEANVCGMKGGAACVRACVRACECACVQKAANILKKEAMSYT